MPISGGVPGGSTQTPGLDPSQFDPLGSALNYSGNPSDQIAANEQTQRTIDTIRPLVQAILLRRGLTFTEAQLDQLVTQLAYQQTVVDQYNYDQQYGTTTGLTSLLSATLNSTTQDDQLNILGAQTISGFGGIPTANQEKLLLGDPSKQKVPQPFDSAYIGNTTLTFGQMGPFGDKEDGIDYAMPAGTAIYTPFAGRIETEDNGKGAWGKRVFVVLPNGWKFAVGHMTAFSVTDGAIVNPGDQIGLSGGDPSDPSSGNSTGAHIELQMIDPNGNFTDPSGLMQQIYSPQGVTFGDLSGVLGKGIAGTGVSAASGTAAYERSLGIDPAMDAVYGPIVSFFKSMFGRDPKATELMDILAHGKTEQQYENYIRSLPSHIPGLPIGAYTDEKTAADKAMQAVFGHPAADSVVKDLYDQGITTAKDVQNWIGLLGWKPAKDVDPSLYAQAYQAATPHAAGLYNDVPDPRHVAAIGQAAGATAITPTDSMQTADPPRTDPRPEFPPQGPQGYPLGDSGPWAGPH